MFLGRFHVCKGNHEMKRKISTTLLEFSFHYAIASAPKLVMVSSDHVLRKSRCKSIRNDKSLSESHLQSERFQITSDNLVLLWYVDV